jgi:putative glycerol-1-phosphate prenyltransferase
MKLSIYSQFLDKKRQGKKSFAVLIDPDKVDDGKIRELVHLAIHSGVDYFFVGGSLVISTHLDQCIQQIKASCDIPAHLISWVSFSS